jgi:hypothetical protein
MTVGFSGIDAIGGITVLRAVFVRTLKPGVTFEQFMDAWVPDEGSESPYPARVSVARNVTDDRQVITTLELDMSMEEFAAARASLTRPDALERLAEIVETTQLEGLYEDVFDGSDL